MSQTNWSDAPLIQVRNHHSADCGIPPHIDGRSPSQYLGYFENQYGEQALLAPGNDSCIFDPFRPERSGVPHSQGSQCDRLRWLLAALDCHAALWSLRRCGVLLGLRAAVRHGGGFGPTTAQCAPSSRLYHRGERGILFKRMPSTSTAAATVRA